MAVSSVQTIPHLSFVKSDSIARKVTMLTAGNLFLFGQMVFGALEGLVVRIVYYICAVFESISEKWKEKINGIYNYSAIAFHRAHSAIHTIDQNFAKIFCSNYKKEEINLREAKEKIKETLRQQEIRANELRKQSEKAKRKTIFQWTWQKVWPSNKSTTRKIIRFLIYSGFLYGIARSYQAHKDPNFSLPSKTEVLRFFNRNFQKLPSKKTFLLWFKNLNFRQTVTKFTHRFR